MDYYQGYEDAMRQVRVRRGTGVAGLVTRLIFSVLYSAFVYAPLLILGYFVATRISHLYSNDLFIKCGLTIIISYLLFALIYFLKGVLIGKRNNNQGMWIVLWLLCIFMTVGIQTIFAHNVLKDFFAERSVANFQVWSWLGAGAIASLIYSHYQFLTNVAPRSVFWAYQFGYLCTKNSLEKGLPNKSIHYFDNAPMKITFRKNPLNRGPIS